MKTVVITGAAKGIGLGIAELLIKEGYNVIINYNKSEKKAKEIEEILLKQNYNIEVDKKKIDLKETIKTLGLRTISIKLYDGVIGNLKVDVISK